MRKITTQAGLETLVAEYRDAPFLTVDTEFMRERTYWPILCLIQIARPGDDDDPDAAAIIDPIEGDLDLGPLFELMAKPDTVKVFHAARQDVEIFHHLSGVAPSPLYDTQIAGMVCGFGDQVGYETLVRKICKRSLDKSSRFTNWQQRPLTPKQLSYALADVTHLREIYLSLSAEIEAAGRAGWVAEEMAALTRSETYVVEPAEAWRRLKSRSSNRRFLAVAKELAEWRERAAQARDVPRARLLKDDALLELCALQPASHEELKRARLVFREARSGEVAEGILAAVRRGLETPKEDQPRAPEPKASPAGATALSELLKVLLKARADQIGVAQRLIASTADLDRLAQEEAPEIAALSGWRREAFGEDALRLKRGELALSAGPEGVIVVQR